MRRLVAVAVVVGALAVPAAAWGGGFVTVGLSSLPDGTTRAGDTWNVDVTVLGHGRAPLPNENPSVIVSRPGVTKTFRAVETGTPGVYRARVVFPSAGTWTVAADEGWAGGPSHEFGSFAIGRADGTAPAVAARTSASPPPVADDGPSTLTALGVALLAALLTTGLLVALERRRVPRARPAAAGG